MDAVLIGLIAWVFYQGFRCVAGEVHWRREHRWEQNVRRALPRTKRERKEISVTFNVPETVAKQNDPELVELVRQQIERERAKNKTESSDE